MTRDHNLLFGVFAVQLKKVTPMQLMDVAASWASDTSRDIPSRMVELKILSSTDCELLSRLVTEAVAAHGGDPTQTLATFGGEAEVHEVYRGSIVLTADGQVSVPPSTGTATSLDTSSPDLGSVRGVFESPGRYTNSIEHARGGMGRVLLVHDDFLGREIALKELLPHLGSHEASTRDRNALEADHPSPVRFSAHIIARFLQEARITGQLEHPSIVPVYELGHRSDGSLYYTMKLVRGRSLSKAIKECGNLVERLRLLPHFVDLCQAIAYAHSREIIHRDIKPANVMVGEFGETVVLDWGLAKKRDREDVHRRDLEKTLHRMNLGDEVKAAQTASGQLLGTPIYMAPEQAKGDLGQIDEQSDVYALGVVLFEILTGVPPFDGSSTREILKKVIAGKSISADVYDKDTPAELIAIAAKAMQADKSRRYTDVRALADEIQRFQSGTIVQAHRYNVKDYTRLIWKRYRPLIVMGAAALLLIMITAGTYTLRLAALSKLEAEARQAAERSVYVASIRLVQEDMERGERDEARTRLLEVSRHYRNWEWGYLYASLDRSTDTLSGHQKGVDYVAFSPDGALLLTVSFDRSARVWDSQSGEERFAIEVHAEGGRGREEDPTTLLAPSHTDVRAAFSSDGRFVLSKRSNETFEVWNTASGERVNTLGDRVNPVFSATFSPEGGRILAKMRGNAIKVLETASGKELFTVGGGADPIYGEWFRPDGDGILIRRKENTFGLIDGHTGAEIFTLVGGGSSLVPGGFSADASRLLMVEGGRIGKLYDAQTGGELATVDLDETGESGHGTVSLDPAGRRIISLLREEGLMNVWDTETGERVAALRSFGSPIDVFACGPDGSLVATTSFDDHIVRIWNTDTGGARCVLRGHRAPIGHIAFSPDGTRVVTASGDRTAKVWDAISGALIISLDGHSGLVNNGVFSPGGARVATTSRDMTIKLWDIPDVQRGVVGGTTLENTYFSAFSPDGKRLVTSAWNSGAVSVMDLETGTKAFVLEGHEQRVAQAAFSADGRYIATVADDGTAKVWDGRTGESQFDLHRDGDRVFDMAFSPDGTRILARSDSGAVTLRNVASGQELLRLRGYVNKIFSEPFSRDGTRILTGSGASAAKIWDATTGVELHTLSGHTDALVLAAFSPDGTRVVTVALDDQVRVWDTRSGKSVFLLVDPPTKDTLTAHDGDILDAAFSPDSSRIVTASWDDTAKVWDSRSGALLLTLRGHTDNLWTAAFSPDGNRIVTASRDKSAKVWDAYVGVELYTLRGHEDEVMAAVFSPDGTRVLTRSKDRSVVLWTAARWDGS